MTPLTSREIAAPVMKRVRAMYDGYTGSLVYFVRRSDPEFVKIGVTTDLFTRTSSFLNGSLEPLTYEAVIPGKQTLEKFFHRRYADQRFHREWFSDGERIVAEAREFAAEVTRGFYETWNVYEALVRALRLNSERYADIERLHSNGVKLKEIAEMAGCSLEEIRSEIDRMRALGFSLAYRRQFAPREMAA